MSSSSQKILLDKYVEAVLHAPQSLGLTAAQTAAEFLERHVLDALKLLQLLPPEMLQQELKMLDVGSGNGVPGIPAAIALPKWQVFLLDSNNKKSGFIDMFCKFNSIKNVQVIVARAEAAAHLPAYREQFDLVFARALGKIPTALELCIPFLKPQGLLVIPHGSNYRSELERSQNALEKLQASLQRTSEYQVGRAYKFTALFFKKDQETPDRYPRKEGTPKKTPL